MKADATLRQTVALTLVKDLGPVRFKKLMEAFSSVGNVFKAGREEFLAKSGLPPRFFEGIQDRALLEMADEEIREASKNDTEILTLSDKRYPALLKEIFAPPALIYVRGRLPDDKVSVAIVGSRNASLTGMAAAKRIAGDLACSGVAVVSGMARGIDTAAHEGTLAVGGSTVAVLGGGIARVYPQENLRLADKIAENGAVVSEFPMTAPARPQNFPIRNRIISGLSQAVLVVEAGEKSGALITVDAALEQGRDVWVVPGSVATAKTAGSNWLLKQGAKCVTDADDILQELKIKKAKAAGPVPATGALSDEERKVLSLLDGEPVGFEELVAKTKFPAGKTASTLSLLEIKRRVRQLPGNHYVRER